MARSTEVGPPVVRAVPELAPTPATTITAGDIAIPRLYVGNYMSDAVKHQFVKFGDIYLATGADDTDPRVLWSLGSDDQGVLMHVLHLRKGKSWAQKGTGSQLFVWDFDDPEAHPEAWTTYGYTLLLPEIDPEMPARLLLTRTGTATARKINTVIARNQHQGPAFINAFRLTAAKRQRDSNEWSVFQAATETADPKHVDQAAVLYTQLAGTFAQEQRSSGADEPTI